MNAPSPLDHDAAGDRRATLYRMAFDGHLCPFGLKARHLLRAQGFTVDDRLLTSRAAVDEFKAVHGVRTTPQVWIGVSRIGGYDDLRRHFGRKVADPEATSYRPVIALFAMTALAAMAASFHVAGTPFTRLALMWFVSLSMIVLALLKLQDLDRFATMFLGYDLLARRWVPYATAYPFLEGGAGVLMTAGALDWLSIPVALFIGTVGAASVFKAVYIEKRALKCACVGGSARVPLGFVSLTENLAMIAMAAAMLAGLF